MARELALCMGNVKYIAIVHTYAHIHWVLGSV